ncbi:MAG: hypothetical protein QOF78_4003 [Phycisphaerales bacterium]|nr:hypothetical protein [Phycisphaerales bacterium]
MRKLIVTLCSGVLLVGGVALSARAADKETKTVEGELVDLHCFAAGGAKGEDHGKSCGAKCAKSGIPVAVLVDGKAWTLATNPAPLADSVGKQVRVTGSANNETQTFLAEKVEVKDGDAWKEVKLKDAHHKGGKDEEKKS